MFHHQLHEYDEDEDETEQGAEEQQQTFSPLHQQPPEFDEATQISELLHDFSTSPPPPPDSLHRLRSLSTRLFRLLDPAYECSAAVPPPHIHSLLQYRDRHRGSSEQSSIVELLPLLLHHIRHATTAATHSPPAAPHVVVTPTAEPPSLPSPSATDHAAPVTAEWDVAGCLSTFLSLQWSLCCLPGLCRLCASLSLSTSHVRQLQASIHRSIMRARTRPAQLLTLFTSSHSVTNDDDSIPVIQSLLALIRRYHTTDISLPAAVSSATAADTDTVRNSPISASELPSLSWLSLLHLMLSQRSSSATTATSLYLLDNNMQHSPALCSYILAQTTCIIEEQLLPTLDHLHLVLLLLMARDEDYRTRCFQLLTQLTQTQLSRSLPNETTDGLATASVPQYSSRAPLVSFTTVLDTACPTIQLWSAAIRVAAVERVPVTSQFALHLLKKHSSSASLLSIGFHIFHLLFISYEHARAGVLDVVLSNICRSSLSLPQRHLFASLLSHLILSSLPSQLSKLHSMVDAFLHNLILLPLPLALHTLLALLPVFIPSVAQLSSAPLDSLHTYLRKWLLHPSREYDVLALSGCLWLLGRWSGWEAEEKGLCKLLEEGLARQTEEGRGWLACRLHQLITHHPPSSTNSLPLSLSAPSSSSNSSLSSLLLQATTRLSSSALSHLRSYLYSRLIVYISKPNSTAHNKPSKWNIVVEHHRLSVAACFRAEWAAVTVDDEEDEDHGNELLRQRREVRVKDRRAGRSKLRKNQVDMEPSTQQENQRCAVLRDPIPLYLLCAWDSLQAEASLPLPSSSSSSFSSLSTLSSSPGTVAIVSLLFSLLDQFLDCALFLPLICNDLPSKSDSALTPTTAALPITERQRWSLLQALCGVLCRITFEDTSRWRRESKAAVEAADKASAASKPVPLSTWTFTSQRPVAAAIVPTEEGKVSAADKNDQLSASLYALLSSLSSSCPIPLPLSCEASSCFYFLEQAAFLQLLLDCSPSSSSPTPSPVSATLNPSSLLSPSLLIDLLSEYSRSISISSSASRVQEKRREPALSLVAIAHTLKLVTTQIPSMLGKAPPTTSSAFESLPATQWIPSLTPTRDPISATVVLSAIYDVFSASLGINGRAINEVSLLSSSPLMISPPSVLGTAVFTSAKQLAALFKLASSTHSATLSSPAWLRATAVYEQPGQYRDEVWTVRLHALLAIKLVLTEQREQASQLCDALFGNRAQPGQRVDGCVLLALLLVRCFHVELEQRMTVTLAHAYIDLVQTLHSLASASEHDVPASLSPSLRLTDTLLHSINEDPELLTADYRLTRKVYTHILSSMQGDSDRERAMSLVQQLISRMMADESQAATERKEREKRTGNSPSRTWLAKRSRRRKREEADNDEHDADGSDDSEFDDDGERRRERFLSRFSRSAVMEAEEARDEERRDKQEMKMKRSRKAVLGTIVRHVTRELSDVRQHWKLSKQARKQATQSPLAELWSRAQAACVFLSQSLSVMSLLTSSTLSSLLDYSFASSASQLPSERPSLALHSPTLAALLEWCRCTLELLHTIDSQLSLHTSDVLPLLLDSNVVDETVATQSVGDGSSTSFGYVVQLPSCSVSSADALLLLIGHMVHVLYSTAASSTVASFLSAAASESVKAIDAKLAIERCRAAALATTNLIARIVKRDASQLRCDEKCDQDDEREAMHNSDEQSSGTGSISRLSGGTSNAVTSQLPRLLSSLQSQLRAGGRNARVRDTLPSKAEAAGRKRPRGGAVLRSRNRVVDALLREEGERGDSYMDLDGFLVADDEEID